jgi:hypothetical protein
MTQEEALGQILARCSEVIRIYYKELYTENVGEATRIVTTNPGRACDEIRNAFDHFSSSFEIVQKILAIDALSGDELDRQVEDALINAERGRRHIALATFYWLREELRAQRGLMKEFIERTSNLSDADSAARYGLDLAKLDERVDHLLSQANTLPREPRHTQDMLREASEEILSAIEAAFGLINEHQTMYERLQSAFK